MYDPPYEPATGSTHPWWTTTYRHNRGYRSTNLDRPQLPATTVQLYSTTQPISAYQHQTSSCTQRLNRPQLTSIKHLAVLNDSTDLSLPASNIQLYLPDSTYASDPRRTPSCEHLQFNQTSYQHHPSSWRSHTTATDIYIHACKYDK